jgi:hypothetical protein
MMAMLIPANAKQLVACANECEGPALELKRSTGLSRGLVEILRLCPTTDRGQGRGDGHA